MTEPCFLDLSRQLKTIRLNITRVDFRRKEATAKRRAEQEAKQKARQEQRDAVAASERLIAERRANGQKLSPFAGASHHAHLSKTNANA